MFDLEFVRDNWLFIASGVGTTLGLAILGLLLATLIAMVVARGRRSAFAVVRALSGFYVWLFDGVPLLLQIFFIFLVLPPLGIVLPGFWAGVLVMGLNYGGRMSGIFYGRYAAQGRVALMPALANELGSMIKDSTLISAIGFVHEVFWRATKVGLSEFHMPEALTIAAVIYLLLFTLTSWAARALRGPLAAARSGAEASA